MPDPYETYTIYNKKEQDIADRDIYELTILERKGEKIWVECFVMKRGDGTGAYQYFSYMLAKKGPNGTSPWVNSISEKGEFTEKFRRKLTHFFLEQHRLGWRITYEGSDNRDSG